MPGHGFLLLGLAQAFEQADAAAVGVEGIDVVDDDELVAVPVELDVHAERRGVALDPARLAVQRGPHRAALGQAAGADEDQQAEMPLGKGAADTPPAGRRSSDAAPCGGVPFGGVSVAGIGSLRWRHSSKAVRFDLDF